MSLTNELLTQIRDGMTQIRDSVCENGEKLTLIHKEMRKDYFIESRPRRKDPLTRIEREVVEEVKARYLARRVISPRCSMLSICTEVFRERQSKGLQVGYENDVSLNHRVYIEIKRMDRGLKPF